MVRSLKEISQQWVKDREMSGWHPIPGHPSYLINMYGEVSRVKDDRLLKVRVGLTGRYVIFQGSDNQKTMVLVRDLMAMVFPDREYKDEKLPPAQRKVSEKPQKAPGEPKWDQKTRTNQSHIPEIEGELWMGVPGFSSYEVSNYARIRFRTTKRHLKPHVKGNYTSVLLQRDGKSVRKAVRWVTESAWGHMGLPKPKNVVVE